METINSLKSKGFKFIIPNEDGVLATRSFALNERNNWYLLNEDAHADVLSQIENNPVSKENKYLYDLRLDRFRMDLGPDVRNLQFKPSVSDATNLIYLRENGYKMILSFPESVVALKSTEDYFISPKKVQALIDKGEADIISSDILAVEDHLEFMYDGVFSDGNPKYQESFFLLKGDELELAAPEESYLTSLAYDDRLSSEQLTQLSEVINEGAMVTIVMEDDFPYRQFGLEVPTKNVIGIDCEKIDGKLPHDEDMVKLSFKDSRVETSLSYLDMYVSTQEQRAYDEIGKMTGNYIDYPEVFFSNRFQITEKLKYAKAKQLHKDSKSYMNYLVEQLVGKCCVSTKGDVYDSLLNFNNDKNPDLQPVMVQFNNPTGRKPLSIISDVVKYKDGSLSVEFKGARRHNNSVSPSLEHSRMHISESWRVNVNNPCAESSEESDLIVYLKRPRGISFLYSQYERSDSTSSFIEYLEEEVFKL